MKMSNSMNAISAMKVFISNLTIIGKSQTLLKLLKIISEIQFCNQTQKLVNIFFKNLKIYIWNLFNVKFQTKESF